MHAPSPAQRPLRAATMALVSCLMVSTPVVAQGHSCPFRGTADALAERPSPLDSVAIPLGGAEAKLCYGRPSARGRTVVGGIDPYGTPWRFGANEATTLHLPFPARLGDVDLEPGSYSLYAIPDRERWTIVVNANTTRWGIPIGADVRAADLGSFSVPIVPLDQHVETLDFSFEGAGDGVGWLVYRWERTSLRIPIARR